MSEPSDNLCMFGLSILARDGFARPLRRWKSVRLYERLVENGYAEEVEDPNPFFRKFQITANGRDAAR